MIYEIVVYMTIGVLSFFIGLIAGYLLTDRHYSRRFVIVAEECEKKDSIVPILTELEKES